MKDYLTKMAFLEHERANKPSCLNVVGVPSTANVHFIFSYYFFNKQ